jgi:enoyl-CoA hydratase/carnithine racemase
MTEVLRRALEDGVLTLILARPEARNALSLQLIKALADALSEAAGNADVRCIVITGEGKAFCAGGDINEMLERAGKAVATKERLQNGLNRIATSIWHLEKPVVAKVNGDATGAGMDLVLVCDLAYAADTARFAASFVRVGLIPDTGGTHTLPRRVGLHKAKELVFLGELISAKEAESLGLINRAVAPGELDGVVGGVAKKLAEGPTKTIGLAKRALHRGLGSTLEEALEHEAYAQGFCFTTDDHQEGSKAFLEKREPKFRGT